ncbi:MAG: histidinol-phosphate transaminase [Eubacteriales bacterium]
MIDYLTKLVKEIEPYVPGEQRADRKYIKLNTNENPFPPSPRVKEGIYTELDRLRLYPDPECNLLKSAVSKEYNVGMENVFIGNGSDEILAFAFPAFFNDGMVAFPNITYSFYPVFANLFQTKFLEMPLNDDFSIDVNSYSDENYRRIHRKSENKEEFQRISGILISNPNAPTGIALKLQDIEKLIQNNQDKLVLIDEAYIDFGGETAVSLVKKYKNLLVVMTFSKSRSLAGLRVGFAIGDVELIDALNKIKNSFNSYTLDRLAIAGATAALLDKEYFAKTRHKIISNREKLTNELIKLDFNVIPSQANFIFVSHERIKAGDLFQKLREEGVLVRYFDKPLIDNYLRITIGTVEDLHTLVQKIKEIILNV